jgi:hypothetical protein
VDDEPAGQPEMLAVNQDALGSKPRAGRAVTAGRKSGRVRSRTVDGRRSVQSGPEAAPVSVALSDLSLTGAHGVRDIWLQKDLPEPRPRSRRRHGHGVVFVRIAK